MLLLASLGCETKEARQPSGANGGEHSADVASPAGGHGGVQDASSAAAGGGVEPASGGSPSDGRSPDTNQGSSGAVEVSDALACSQPVQLELSGTGTFGPSQYQGCLNVTAGQCLSVQERGAQSVLCGQSASTITLQVVSDGWSVTSVDPSDGVTLSAAELSGLKEGSSYLVRLDKASTVETVEFTLAVVSRTVFSLSFARL